MSIKRNSYSAEFKTKVIFEHLSWTTINSLASKYQISPTNIQKRKSIFLKNISSVFETSTNKKDEYYQKLIDDLTNQIWQLTIQLNRLKKKLDPSHTIKDLI